MLKKFKKLSSFLVLFGLVILISEPAYAQFGNSNSGGGNLNLNIDSDRIVAVINLILGYLEGSFGALVMVIGGILAIISAAFGQYKAAMGLLIVAVGCFILRSIVNTFFGGILNSNPVN